VPTKHPEQSRYARVRAWLLRWPGRSRRFRAPYFLAVIGICVFVAAAILALYSWAAPFDAVDNTCNSNAFGCNAVIELAGTIVTVVVAFASFVYWRVFKVANAFRADARDDAWQLLERMPRNELDRKVIGRDGICTVIQESLQDPESRRPQLIVGPIGAGKTAVLVELTRRLAADGAVPVPIRMRGATPDFSFLSMAKETFLKQVDRKLITEDEGKKIWKKLCDHRRVVVLADGLEEVLDQSTAAAVHFALDEAREDNIPLVVASRPHEELRGVDAAVIRLEPLEAEEVVRHLGSLAGGSADAIRPLAQAAEIAESPFYLRLARELCDHLGSLDPNRPRLLLRVQLLDEWTTALIEGSVGDVNGHLTAAKRDEVVSLAETVACATLKQHTLELCYEELDETPIPNPRGGTINGRAGRGLGRDAEALALMERVQDRLRFQHSMIQSYLAARRLPAELDAGPADRLRALLRSRAPNAGRPARNLAHGQAGYLDEALDNPNRELLIALVICCCRHQHAGFRKRLRNRLLDEAKRRRGRPISFDLLAAAYEIDTMLGGDGATRLLKATGDVWTGRTPRFSGGRALPAQGRSVSAPYVGEIRTDHRTLDAKLRAITRMEEARNRESYLALWAICLREQNYRVRVHAAQALGGGGNAAYAAVKAEIEEALTREPRLRSAKAATEAKREDVRRVSLQGWLLPLLAGTCTGAEGRLVRERLEWWVRRAQRDLHLGVVTCFAQGFKFQANRMKPCEADAKLIDLCERLLDAPGWWYSQLSLVQALALFALRRPAYAEQLSGVIACWCDDSHPYVSATARLCQEMPAAPSDDFPPSRYVWIDEAGVAAKIGPLTSRPDKMLWIPEATGWLSLDTRARQLAAEVFVYINLIEQGDRDEGDGDETEVERWRDERSRERESRRRQVRERGALLPGCLMFGAEHDMLQVSRDTRAAARGVRRCSERDSGCGFGLCPYPRGADEPFRGELNETFCRAHRQLLAGRDGLRTLQWRDETATMRPLARSGRGAVVQLWEQMEKRAREPTAGVGDD
jgi:hypothetical protein